MSQRIIRAGAPRKFDSPVRLASACNAYFKSISRTITLKEKIELGTNAEGEPIFEIRTIVNDDGKPIETREYLCKPSITALCNYLHICRDTWAEYSKLPGYAEVCRAAKQEVEAYLISRLGGGKGDSGIQFELSHNYGWKNKIELEAGEATRKSMTEARLSTAEKLQYLSKLGFKVTDDEDAGD